MNPGELRHRIEFGNFINTSDSEGFTKKVWAPEFKAWSSAQNLYGREFWAAKAVQGENTVKFKCRYNSKINSSLYIMFQDNYYEIIAPPDDIGYLHKEMEIKARLLEKDKIDV
jgi:SPP1 family predicted phage head-tail adaptor